ncbi:MAG TPA: hypothetical protein VGR64_04390, partial [Terracidiphilus sp.]|nr:hypothetical protein [Terracidiphilus sp.]
MVFVGLLVLAATTVTAQAPKRIDDRIHPELIPDNAAYRAVFIMQSHFATQEETARSEQFHKMLNLSASDHEAYDQAMVKFRQGYDLLVKTHDDYVDTSSMQSAQDVHEEVVTFRQNVSALVKSTR